jgi:hypothetical protein
MPSPCKKLAAVSTSKSVSALRNTTNRLSNHSLETICRGSGQSTSSRFELLVISKRKFKGGKWFIPKASSLPVARWLARITTRGVPDCAIGRIALVRLQVMLRKTSKKSGTRLQTSQLRIPARGRQHRLQEHLHQDISRPKKRRKRLEIAAREPIIAQAQSNFTSSPEVNEMMALPKLLRLFRVKLMKSVVEDGSII